MTEKTTKKPAKKSSAKKEPAKKAAPSPTPVSTPAPAPTLKDPSAATAENVAGRNVSNVSAKGETPPPVIVNAQYIKDLSFEAPGAPHIFKDMQKQQPDISINIDVRAQPLHDNVFEVVLHITSECKVGDKIAFIQELVYGGVFSINVPHEHIQAVLLIECPRLLFPFARNIIADSSRDGGFPPLMLGPIDFVSMFKNRQEAPAHKEGSPSIN